MARYPIVGSGKVLKNVTNIGEAGAVPLSALQGQDMDSCRQVAHARIRLCDTAILSLPSESICCILLCTHSFLLTDAERSWFKA